MAVRARWFAGLVLVPLALVLSPVPAAAGAGAGELSLDRGAVGALVDLQLAEVVRRGIPGAALAGFRLRREGPVDFRDGGIDLRVRVEIPVAGISVVLPVRYRPRVDRESGTVRLVPEVAREGAGTLPLDPATFLPELALPRLFRQELPGGPTGRTRLTLSVQGLDVRDDRVVLRFGVLTRALPPREDPR